MYHCHECTEEFEQPQEVLVSVTRVPYGEGMIDCEEYEDTCPYCGTEVDDNDRISAWEEDDA